MQIAAKIQDRHLAFISLSGLGEMLSDIRSAIDVGPPDAVSAYCPEDLEKQPGDSMPFCALTFRNTTWPACGRQVYPDINAFLAAHLKQPGL